MDHCAQGETAILNWIASPEMGSSYSVFIKTRRALRDKNAGNRDVPFSPMWQKSQQWPQWTGAMASWGTSFLVCRLQPHPKEQGFRAWSLIHWIIYSQEAVGLLRSMIGYRWSTNTRDKSKVADCSNIHLGEDYISTWPSYTSFIHILQLMLSLSLSLKKTHVRYMFTFITAKK